MRGEYFRVVDHEGLAAVQVDDWELFDWLDDILTEAGYEYTHMTEGVVAGGKVFTMNFAVSVSRAELKEVLGRVPDEEWQRVWQLNNS